MVRGVVFPLRLFLFFVFKSHAVGWYYQDSVAVFLAKFYRYLTDMSLKKWSRKPTLKKEPKGLVPGINLLLCCSAN